MATFHIKLVNRDFTSTNSIDAPSAEAARSEALKGGLQVGMEEVCGGKPFFGAEIRIESEEGVVERMMVAMGTTPLR